jgi:hypothetical protein
VSFSGRSCKRYLKCVVLWFPARAEILAVAGPTLVAGFLVVLLCMYLQ